MVRAAYRRARAALEKTWTDQCTIIQQEKVTDPVTHITDFQEAVLLENQPCKLSFKTLSAADGEPVAAVSQSVKLFLSPDDVIPAGCKVVVTRPYVNRIFTYASSGEPAVYHTHQEINLELWKGWV